MATKSITKDVVMRSKPLARSLIQALENAEAKQSQVVTYDKTVHVIPASKLREMFKVK